MNKFRKPCVSRAGVLAGSLRGHITMYVRISPQKQCLSMSAFGCPHLRSHVISARRNFDARLEGGIPLLHRLQQEGGGKGSPEYADFTNSDLDDE